MIELEDPTTDYITKRKNLSVLYDLKLKYTSSLAELKNMIITKVQNGEWTPNICGSHMYDYTNEKNVYPVVYSYIFFLKAVKENYTYDVLYEGSIFAFR